MHEKAQLLAFGRNRRTKLAAMITAVFLAVAASVTGAGTAKADVPFRGVQHVWLNLGEPGAAAVNQYSAFIESLRDATGHTWTGGIRETQVAAGRNELIRVDLNAGSARLQLWVSPDNLYVRGFTAMNGVTYQFQENDGYSLGSVMDTIRTYGLDGNGRGLLPAANYRNLGYSGNYGDLSRPSRANRSLSEMPINWGALWDAVFNLAYTTSPGPDTQHVARSLMTLIQFTSEAARFWDVYGMTAAVIVNGDRTYNGVPSLQEELEHAWGALSNYALEEDRGDNPPSLTVTGVGTFSNQSEVERRVAVIQAAPTFSQIVADPWHTEL